jgi:hypothetical protein
MSTLNATRIETILRRGWRSRSAHLDGTLVAVAADVVGVVFVEERWFGYGERWDLLEMGLLLRRAASQIEARSSLRRG